MLKSAGSRKRKLDPSPPATSRSLFSDVSQYCWIRGGNRWFRDGMLLRSGLRLAVPVEEVGLLGGETQTQRENLPDSESGGIRPDPQKYIGDPDENLAGASESHKETLEEILVEAKPSPEDYRPMPYIGKDVEEIKKSNASLDTWNRKLKAKYSSEPLDALPPQPRLYMGDDPKETSKNKLKRKIWRYQNQAWIKQQREKRLASSGSVEVRRIKPPAGLTQRELGLISPYLVKQSFEIDGVPVPDEYVEFKAFLDQVRISPYNVKVSYKANFYMSAFYCLDNDKFKEYPYMKKHLKEAIKLVVKAVGKEKEQLYKAVGGFNNFIQIKWHYLLSQDVRDASGTLQTVEAYLYFTPVQPLKVLEWKLKQDSKVIFCTEKTID